MTTKGKNVTVINGINIDQEIEQGTLRIALAWEIEKRVSQLFLEKDAYRKELFRAYAQWHFTPVKERSTEVITIQATASESYTGQPFTLAVPIKDFLFYSTLTWIQVEESKIPKYQPLIIKAEMPNEVTTIGILQDKNVWRLMKWDFDDSPSELMMDIPYFKSLD